MAIALTPVVMLLVALLLVTHMWWLALGLFILWALGIASL